MAYITYQQYVNLYGNSPITEAEFPVYAELASDMIDTITQNRLLQGDGLASLPAFVQTRVEKAAAAQVLYFTQNGLETVLSGQTGQSFTVGKVSVSGGALTNGKCESRLLAHVWQWVPCRRSRSSSPGGHHFARQNRVYRHPRSQVGQ